MHLPLVVVESNLAEVFPEPHVLSSTYRILAAVYLLKKLWGRYYLSSDGAGLSVIDLRNNELRACAYYDTLTCSCLSTGKLHLFSDGCAVKRYEKTSAVAAYPAAYDQLHVCVSDSGKNCGRCIKCKRTLLTLDALNQLERFEAVFDISFYKNNKHRYFAYLYAQHLLKKANDNMIDGNDMKTVYERLYDQLSARSKLEGLWLALRILLARNSMLKRLYFACWKKRP